MAASPADGVQAVAEPVAAAAGLVLESVTVTPAGKRRVLRLVVDLPEDRTGGVPLESVAEVSRSLIEALDASDVMGGNAYVLEVSSPGVDRPLTERRHWLRARGRMVKLEAPPATPGLPGGRLTAVDDDGVELDGERRIGWAQIVKGRVEVEFGRTEEAFEDEETDEEG